MARSCASIGWGSDARPLKRKIAFDFEIHRFSSHVLRQINGVVPVHEQARSRSFDCNGVIRCASIVRTVSGKLMRDLTKLFTGSTTL